MDGARGNATLHCRRQLNYDIALAAAKQNDENRTQALSHEGRQMEASIHAMVQRRRHGMQFCQKHVKRHYPIAAVSDYIAYTKIEPKPSVSRGEVEAPTHNRSSDDHMF